MNTDAILVVMAMAGELIDSSLGMMYGTLLSPILILMGYDPKLVVPSILISQGVSGLIATVKHNSLGNGDFGVKTTDTKIAWSMVAPGIIATVLGVSIAASLSGFAMSMYIGILVVILGALCLSPRTFSFSWIKVWGIGLLAGFNKAMSGGGFGPVTTTGKLLGGVDPKVSVATTTYAEAPICFLGFGLWIAFNGWIRWQVPVLLTVGAIAGALLGPHITQQVKTEKLRKIVGILTVVSGAILLIKLVT
jgi:uncharacterized protein